MVHGSSFLILIWLARPSSERRYRTRTSTLDPALHGAVPSQHSQHLQNSAKLQIELLLKSSAEIIQGTNQMIYRTGDIRDRSDQCASFEIGFVFRSLQETFRKMLDLYNTTVQIRTKTSDMGHIAYLQKVEQLHWEVYHYHNMMHEIERKYKMDAVINGSGVFEDGQRWTRSTTGGTERETWSFSWKKRTTSWWRPLEYGWNTDYYEWT